VLVKTRYLALQGATPQRLATLLDWAERLADDITTSDDDFRQFTEHLEGLGEDEPEFAGILRDYHAERPG
jgi:hypothetical protein